MVGEFKNNRLYLNLKVSGSIKDSEKTLSAQIDTGYDGALTIPFSEAFPFGFALIGTKTYSIADESKVIYFTCVGKVDLAGKTETVYIDVAPNGSILVGMTLLPKLCKEMQIDFVNRTFLMK